MSKTYTDQQTGEQYTLPDFCKSVAQLKRILGTPGLTLERMPTAHLPHKAPRTIAKIKAREIVFSDGAHLSFPTAEQFRCEGDIVFWNTLAFRISLTPEAVAASANLK